MRNARTNDKIVCSTCKIEKPATKKYFYFRKDTGSFRRQCCSCKDHKTKEWESCNQDKMLAWRKQWHDTYNKKYYDINREKELIRTRNRPKDRVLLYERKRNSKPQRRLRNNISRSISFYMSGSGGKKGLSHLKFVDWTYDELIAWIESKFEPWMNWNNYGPYNRKTWDDNAQSTWTWQIDHIIPHSSFKYETMDCPEFRQCWALENLRPYSAKQNNIDRNNR